MKINIKTNCGQNLTIYSDSGFQVLVDDELLLDHCGINQVLKDSLPREDWGDLLSDENTDSINECYSKTSGASSLFPDRCEPDCKCHNGKYICFEVPSSSFIKTIRWWEYDEGLGDNALEVSLKDGRVVSYVGVPKSDIDYWIQSINGGYSAGRWYNANIKGNYELVFPI